MEQKIIATLLQSRENWEKVKDLIESSDLSPDGTIILGEINEYYQRDTGATHCDPDLIGRAVARTCSSEKTTKRIQGILEGLSGVSTPNVINELLSIRRHNVGLELSSILSAGRSGEEVNKLIEQYSELAGVSGLGGASEELEVQSGDVRSLLETSFNDDKLIKLYPRSLNAACDGGARPGHHILVFAPTEMGKSLFVINLTKGFTEQGLRTLYIGNEDPTADLMMRYICNITGQPKHVIKRNPGLAQRTCDAASYERLTLVGLAPGNFKQIRELVDKYKPHVVVLDQLRNIDVDSENRTQALEKAATEARNLGKSKGVLVVSVAQAGDSASGKRYLNRGDVDGSNVGIPGQVDLMIGIGADEEMEKSNLRMLSFPKNKLSGNHEPITITIDPITSRVLEDYHPSIRPKIEAYQNAVASADREVA